MQRCTKCAHSGNWREKRGEPRGSCLFPLETLPLPECVLGPLSRYPMLPREILTPESGANCGCFRAL